ncbi:hypothetical protein [Micromonospora chersina]|uniref:hypothetical protein n=1 Tax=Micromonospora chersina TaxID=47854 RepID=UPI003717772E
MAEDRPDTVRSPLDRATERTGRALAHARAEGGAAGRLRLRQLEVTVVIAVQSGLAAALAALLAQRLLGPGAHVFAIFDALGGGLVGLLVVALLLPVNPLRVLDRATEPIVTTLTTELDAVARALTPYAVPPADAHARPGLTRRGGRSA